MHVRVHTCSIETESNALAGITLLLLRICSLLIIGLGLRSTDGILVNPMYVNSAHPAIRELGRIYVCG